MTDNDDRIFALEGRLNKLEIQLTEIAVQLTTVSQIGKVIALLVGAALGIDVLPMLGA